MRAPRLARLLLEWTIPADRLDDAIGDLEESHRGRVRSTWDAIRIAAAFTLHRFTAASARGSVMTVTDLRHAARLLIRQPLTSLTAIVALTLGIGIATVGFATMEAMLFSRLPWDADGRWIKLQAVTHPSGEPTALAADSLARVNQLEGLAHVGAASSTRATLAWHDGRTDDVLVAGITPSSLSLVPVVPQRGRVLLPEDAAPGAPAAVMLSERLLRRTGAGYGDVNSTLTLAGQPHIVVGVVPDGVKFPNSPDVWIAVDEGFRTGARTLPSDARLFAVMLPGITLGDIAVRAAAMDGTLVGGRDQSEARVEITAYTDVGRMGTELSTAITIAVTAVLLVIAANVGNLVLARSFARSHEFALRAALGASRRRLVTQVALEVLCVGLVAAGLGVLVAGAILRQLNAMDELPFWVDFTGGPLTAGLVAAATLLATLVAGAWPALRATRRDLLPGLQSGSARGGDVRFGRVAGGMVIAQIAVSVMMLHGALVVAQAFRSFTQFDLPLPDNVLTTGLNVNAVRTSPDGSRSTPLTAETVAEAVASVPGVLASGVATALPRHSPPARRIEIDSPAGPSFASTPAAGVSEGYFDALGAEPTAGRLFTRSDMGRGATPVAIVNEPFVERLVGGGTPIGMRFREVKEDNPGPWITIVGVVPDLGLSVGNPDLAAGYYTPIAPDDNQIYIAARVTGPPLPFAGPVRDALRARDPLVTPFTFQRLADVASEDVAFFAGFSQALLVMGVVTLGLALVGVYSMMALLVSRRTREIGIRMALGASTQRIIGSIAGRAAAQILAGAVLGGVLAVASLQLRSVLVSRMGDGGSWTLPIVLTTLAGAALAATWIPMRRALGVRPQEALRT
jgi:predicted permease